MRKPFPNPYAGFTLIEVLIAIVITALIGLGSWQVLNSAIRINERTTERIEELTQLQRFMLFLSRDMQQITHRSIRNEFGDSEAALTTENDFYQLLLTKVGWRNPLADQRSDLQRVAYELDQENVIYRHYWQVLDRAQDSEPRGQKLLSGVEELNFSFLNSEGGWVTQWPPETQSDTSNEEGKDPYEAFSILPKAIRVTLKHEKFGEIVRLFDLVSYQRHQDLPEPPDNEEPPPNPS